MSGRLRPTAPIAPDVVLVEDPALAMALAQRLLEKPRMANHSYGLWGYSGATPQGLALTVHASGIGGPSLAVVVAELAAHGARRFARAAACRSLDPRLGPRELLLVEDAVASDGASRALGAACTVAADAALLGSLAAVAGPVRRGRVIALDLPEAAPAASDGGAALAADLATAPLYALGSSLGLGAIALLLTAEPGAPDEALAEDLLRAGEACGAALARAQASSETTSPLP